MASGALGPVPRDFPGIDGFVKTTSHSGILFKWTYSAHFKGRVRGHLNVGAGEHTRGTWHVDTDDGMCGTHG